MSASIVRVDGAEPWMARTGGLDATICFAELEAARDFLRARGFDLSSGSATNGHPEIWVLVRTGAR